MAFRDDILRGVRLFLIAFATILITLTVYRLLRGPSDMRRASAPAEVPNQTAAAPEAPPPDQNPSPETAPKAEPTAETHGLVVPPPPPAGGTTPRVSRPRSVGVAPPPVARRAAASLRPAASGKDFESSEAGSLPSASVEESPDGSPVPAKNGVGYKSLIDANANRSPEEPVAQEAAGEATAGDAAGKPAKGNRFFHAVGKIFHPGSKKETTPMTLQPKPE